MESAYHVKSIEEGRIAMRISDMRPGKFGSSAGKILMALVFVATVCGSVFVAPASGDQRNRRDVRQGKGWHQHERYDHRRYDHRRPVYRYDRRYYPNPWNPPPVVYDPVPYQSPGINLIFPIEIR
jgi:hypothetical protein